MKYTLKQWRAMRDITQTQLAEMSGISQSKIAQIESLTPDDAKKIREALKLKPTDSISMPFD